MAFAEYLSIRQRIRSQFPRHGRRKLNALKNLFYNNHQRPLLSVDAFGPRVTNVNNSGASEAPRAFLSLLFFWATASQRLG